MPRRDLASLHCVVFGVALVVGPRLAHAEPASPPPAVEQPVAEPKPSTGPPAQPARAGIELLASVGWGASTDDVLGLELSPYGASFGLDFGYVWAIGFRLGGYAKYSLGRSVSQNYDPLIGRSFDLTADTSSLNTGLSIAYDVPIHGFILRYIVGAGATVMRTDFGLRSPRGYSDSPTVGFHVAPGATLLWPYDWFEGGLGFRYLVQANGAIPSGFLGELLFGVKL